MTDNDDKSTNAEPEAEPRKDKVLHTRIPVVLEEELKRAASSLRVPVSNLVRTILEDAVAAAQAVGRAAEEELRGAAERLGDERDKLRRRAEASGEAVGRATADAQTAEAEAGDEAEAEAVPDEEPGEEERDPLAGVLGFQPLVLAMDSECAKCGRKLEAGDDAFLGVTEGAGSKVIVGPECVPGRK